MGQVERLPDALNTAHDVVHGAVIDSLPIRGHVSYLLVEGSVDGVDFLRDIGLVLLLVLLWGLWIGILVLRYENRLTLILRLPLHHNGNACRFD